MLIVYITLMRHFNKNDMMSDAINEWMMKMLWSAKNKLEIGSSSSTTCILVNWEIQILSHKNGNYRLNQDPIFPNWVLLIGPKIGSN